MCKVSTFFLNMQISLKQIADKGPFLLNCAVFEDFYEHNQCIC